MTNLLINALDRQALILKTRINTRITQPANDYWFAEDGDRIYYTQEQQQDYALFAAYNPDPDYIDDF
ncbi:hypothetical protein [Pseudanabaena sp. PCC 6802]|uniref:hypothetical protein n=1 Tax=Pseudanabaena sp. PCC 6802 TaxID=118173 RepID=UPI000347AC71|nr:hypothetical protein [Pseudanabaena sp. PCC 6802]